MHNLKKVLIKINVLAEYNFHIANFLIKHVDLIFIYLYNWVFSSFINCVILNLHKNKKYRLSCYNIYSYVILLLRYSKDG